MWLNLVVFFLTVECYLNSQIYAYVSDIMLSSKFLLVHKELLFSPSPMADSTF